MGKNSVKIKNSDPQKILILSILTLNLYSFYWFNNWIRQINKKSDPKPELDNFYIRNLVIIYLLMLFLLFLLAYDQLSLNPLFSVLHMISVAVIIILLYLVSFLYFEFKFLKNLNKFFDYPEKRAINIWRTLLMIVFGSSYFQYRINKVYLKDADSLHISHEDKIRVVTLKEID